MNELLNSTLETLLVVSLSSLSALLLGLPLAILLVLSQKGGLRERLILYRMLDTLINLLRSVPFIILMVLIFPLSKLIVGRKTGTMAMVVPLAFAAAPFVARVMEQSLNEVERGEVEAAIALGSSPGQIVRRVLIPEAMPALVKDMTTTVINIIGYSAMAGSIGAGGLGDLAVRSGYYNDNYWVLIQAVVVIILIVHAVQIVGHAISRAIDKK